MFQMENGKVNHMQYMIIFHVHWKTFGTNGQDLQTSYAMTSLSADFPWWRRWIMPVTYDSAVFDTLQWRHNERDGVSNRRPLDCLHDRLFRRRSKKTSKIRVTGLCVRGIHRWPVNSPHKGPVTRKLFLFDDVIMWHIKVSGSNIFMAWQLQANHKPWYMFLTTMHDMVSWKQFWSMTSGNAICSHEN